jgi:hypothetical protein
MPELPADVRDYLSSEDVLYRAELLRRSPDTMRLLEEASTAAAVREWLGSQEAQGAEAADLVVGALNYLTRRPSADGTDEELVARFRSHPSPRVRLRALEYEASRRFQSGDTQALIATLAQMLEDDHETVRAQSARLIRRADLGDEMRDTLAEWHRRAERRRDETAESRELVGELLRQT